MDEKKRYLTVINRTCTYTPSSSQRTAQLFLDRTTARLQRRTLPDGCRWDSQMDG